jgi:hypothetical protein
MFTSAVDFCVQKLFRALQKSKKKKKSVTTAAEELIRSKKVIFLLLFQNFTGSTMSSFDHDDAEGTFEQQRQEEEQQRQLQAEEQQRQLQAEEQQRQLQAEEQHRPDRDLVSLRSSFFFSNSFFSIHDVFVFQAAYFFVVRK